MIVGKCLNPAAGYGIAEWRSATVRKGARAAGHAVTIKALVPQENFRSQAALRLNLHDASFVVHLIATAEQAQTRDLRRAPVENAISYYDEVKKVASSRNRVMATALSRVV
ncbi:MAG TPA: hypothetical protein VGC26_09650 [Afipia sp.]